MFKCKNYGNDYNNYCSTQCDIYLFFFSHKYYLIQLNFLIFSIVFNIQLNKFNCWKKEKFFSFFNVLIAFKLL